MSHALRTIEDYQVNGQKFHDMAGEGSRFSSPL